MIQRLLFILFGVIVCAGSLAARPVPATPQGTPTIILAEPYTVPPNQPVPQPRSTVGIINAVCDVTLDFVGCNVIPGSINILCDTNADGVPELMIPLKNVMLINPLLVRATVPPLGPQLPGTPFPLACCGGKANAVLSQTITAGDDNIFGTYTITQTVEIDLGQRAPVVISTSPSSLDCAVPQNLIVPGACFLLGDGKPNVTAVFAVDRSNPANVVQSKAFVIVNSSVIDALFDFGAANAGKTFLIYAAGPNGTSRNLTALPEGTPTPCPLGNEQGVQVTVTCRAAASGGGTGGDPGSVALNERCELERDAAGAFSLVISGGKYPADSTLTIGGITPKKVKVQDLDAATGMYQKLLARKKFCNGLPGNVVITSPTSGRVTAFFCNQSCTP